MGERRDAGTAPAIALLAYEDLDATVHTWARLATSLGRLGHRPLYIEALRRPSAAELARVVAARGRWSPCASAPDAHGVVRCTPLDLPAQRLGTAARWDKRSLSTAVARHADRGWLVVFSSAIGKPWPRPAGWRLCYFPVDEFAAESEVYARREERILAECDLLVSVTESVVGPRRDRVPAAAVLPNGYDPELFGARPAPAADIDRLPRPRVGYVGTISSSKVDVPLVARLAAALPQVQFVLAGPVAEPVADDGSGVLDPLADLPNVHVLAGRAREDVAAVYAGLDVCLLPYRDTPMNRACSPLKAREALALGLPVVSTQVDELAEHPEAAWIGRTDDELVDLVTRGARGELVPSPDAVRWFTDGTWDARAQQFVELLGAVSSQTRERPA